MTDEPQLAPDRSAVSGARGPFSLALVEAYAAHREAYQRICGKWAATPTTDKKAKHQGYLDYLTHKDELDAFVAAANRAWKEWRKSGEAWPHEAFPRPDVIDIWCWWKI